MSHRDMGRFQLENTHFFLPHVNSTPNLKMFLLMAEIMHA